MTSETVRFWLGLCGVSGADWPSPYLPGLLQTSEGPPGGLEALRSVSLGALS